MIKRIKNTIKKYNLEKYPNNIQVWLISFEYNLWKMPNNYKRYLDNKYYTALWNLMNKYIYSGWEKLWGLIKRREEEREVVVNWFNKL